MSNTSNVIYNDKARRMIDQMTAPSTAPGGAARAGRGMRVPGRHVPARDGDQSSLGPVCGRIDRRRAAAACSRPQPEPRSRKLRLERNSSSRLPIRPRSWGAQSPRTAATDRARSSRREVRWRFPTANEYTSWSMTPARPDGRELSRRPGCISSAITVGSRPSIRRKHMLFVHGMVQTGQEILDGRSQTFSLHRPQVFHRMLRQRSDGVGEAHA